MHERSLHKPHRNQPSSMPQPLLGTAAHLVHCTAHERGAGRLADGDNNGLGAVPLSLAGVRGQVVQLLVESSGVQGRWWLGTAVRSLRGQACLPGGALRQKHKQN